MSEAKFSVGDEVEVTEETIPNNADKGEVVKITQVKDRGMGTYGYKTSKNEDTYSILPEGYLELAENEEDEELEEGDRVRIRENARDNGLISSGDILGEEGIIKTTNSNSKWCYNIVVEFDDSIKSSNESFNSNQLELIEKGDTMQDVEDLDAVAVVGDDSLKEKLLELAKENGYHGSSSPERETLLFCDDRGRVYHNSINFANETIGENDIFRNYSRDNKEILELPEDWSKAKEFVTKDSIEEFEVNGRDVEVEDGEVTIGCWSRSIDEVIQLRDALSDVGATSGTITVSGEGVEKDVIFDLAEWLEQNFKDDNNE